MIFLNDCDLEREHGWEPDLGREGFGEVIDAKCCSSLTILKPSAQSRNDLKYLNELERCSFEVKEAAVKPVIEAVTSGRV